MVACTYKCNRQSNFGPNSFYSYMESNFITYTDYRLSDRQSFAESHKVSDKNSNKANICSIGSTNWAKRHFKPYLHI
jgi:hypothetical protein